MKMILNKNKNHSNWKMNKFLILMKGSISLMTPLVKDQTAQAILAIIIEDMGATGEVVKAEEWREERLHVVQWDQVVVVPLMQDVEGVPSELNQTKESVNSTWLAGTWNANSCMTLLIQNLLHIRWQSTLLTQILQTKWVPPKCYQNKNQDANSTYSATILNAGLCTALRAQNHRLSFYNNLQTRFLQITMALRVKHPF